MADKILRDTASRGVLTSATYLCDSHLFSVSWWSFTTSGACQIWFLNQSGNPPLLQHLTHGGLLTHSSNWFSTGCRSGFSNTGHRRRQNQYWFFTNWTLLKNKWLWNSNPKYTKWHFSKMCIERLQNMLVIIAGSQFVTRTPGGDGR